MLHCGGFGAVTAGFCASVSNTVITGYPVLAGLVGHIAATPMSITVLIIGLVFFPVFIFAYEFAYFYAR